MHRKAFQALLCTLGLALPRVLLAADYYVRVGGDDAGFGTSAQTAWASVARVNAASFRPGDRVCFQGGQEFRGNLRLGPGGGQSNAPIVITSFGSGRAILSAGQYTGITIDSVAR